VNKMPLFSIIIPAFNAAETIGETLGSVIAQTYEGEYEAIIVNDGSTDSTEQVVTSIAEGNPRLTLVNQTNAGIASAYNTGIGRANGEWIVMLSADDVLEPDHLDTFARTIAEYPEVALLSSNGYFLYDDGRRAIVYPEAPWFGEQECALSDLFDQCLYATGIALKKSACESAGGFIADLYAEDYYLFLRMLAGGYRHRYIPKCLSQHRRNRRQRSAQGLSMRQTDLASIERIAREFSLTTEQQQAFEGARKKLQNNIRLRRRLYRIAGPLLAERAIETFRRE